MGRAWVPEANEVQDTTICWQGDGHSILGRKRRYYVGLFTQEKYNNWSVLCKLARPAENRHREKRRGKLSKGVLLQQDNARVHTFKVTMDAVERNGYELIPHSAYSSDLAPSYFFLFPNLKKYIRRCHFRFDEEWVTAVEEWVNGKDPDFFSSGLMALEHYCSRCNTLDGNYIEKEEKKRWILHRSKLCWLFIDSPSYRVSQIIL